MASPSNPCSNVTKGLLGLLHVIYGWLDLFYESIYSTFKANKSGAWFTIMQVEATWATGVELTFHPSNALFQSGIPIVSVKWSSHEASVWLRSELIKWSSLPGRSLMRSIIWKSTRGILAISKERSVCLWNTTTTMTQSKSRTWPHHFKHAVQEIMCVKERGNINHLMQKHEACGLHQHSTRLVLS